MNQAQSLDATFAALADPTRREILARLATGEASVTELAKPFAMSQPAISRHLKVLESAGLITRSKSAQRRIVSLNVDRLSAATGWLQAAHDEWQQRFDNLDQVLTAEQQAETS